MERSGEGIEKRKGAERNGVERRIDKRRQEDPIESERG